MTEFTGAGQGYAEQVPPQFETVDALQEHFTEVFGERNAVYLSDRRERIRLLHVEVADLVKAMRLNDPATTEMAFARIGARIFCLANGILDVPLSRGLEMKYPSRGCAYCGGLPCCCGEARPDASLNNTAGGEQSGWSMRNWQRFLADLYGQKNAERTDGHQYAVNRLFAEVTELDRLEWAIHSRFMKVDDIRREYVLELADTQAWTLGLATMLGVDLQTAMEARYGGGCPTCSSNRCACTLSDFEHVYV